MSNDRGRYRREPGDLVSRILDLERRLSRVERTPNLGNASIDKGTLRVKDESGIVRVELGLLSDGSYGLNVKETAEEEGFHQVPFVYTDFVTSALGDTCSSATYGDLATPGPSKTVPIRSTGKILIIASAQIQAGLNTAASTTFDGRFDVEFSGANTRVPDEANDPLVGVASTNVIVSTGTNSGTRIFTVTASATFTGLNAGATTITMKYRRSASASVDPQFFRRELSIFNL